MMRIKNAVAFEIIVRDTDRFQSFHAEWTMLLQRSSLGLLCFVLLERVRERNQLPSNRNSRTFASIFELEMMLW